MYTTGILGLVCLLWVNYEIQMSARTRAVFKLNNTIDNFHVLLRSTTVLCTTIVTVVPYYMLLKCFVSRVYCTTIVLPVL